MRARDFLREAIGATGATGATTDPQPDQSGLDTDIDASQETEKPQPLKLDYKMRNQLATYLNQAARGEPVQSTGNTGVDNLLFGVAGLQKGLGVLGTVTNLASRGLARAGSAFAQQAGGVKRTTFTAPRSGREISKGISTNPDDSVKLAKSTQKVTGLQRIPMQQFSQEEVTNIFVQAAEGKPVKPTGNQGIDYLLYLAKLIPSYK